MEQDKINLLMENLVDNEEDDGEYQLYINDVQITRYDNIIIENIKYHITNDGAQSDSREPVTHPATNTLIKNPKLSFLYSWITSKENRDLIITSAREITIIEPEDEGFILADGDDLYTSDYELFIPVLEDKNSLMLANGDILYTINDEVFALVSEEEEENNEDE